MVEEDRAQWEGDEEGERNPPLSRAEELMQAHPDIKVLRSPYSRGQIEITQRVENRWRHILIDVEQEKGSQRHYPTIKLSAYETPRNTLPYEDISRQIRSYGLETIIKVHVEDDEQVTTEVGYDKRLPYPHDFKQDSIEFIELYSLPIPAQELVATARIGLGMLKAYREASLDQQIRIYENNFGRRWDNISGQTQFYDGEPGRNRDMDAYLSEVSPLFANAMDAMLPGEMPPAPPNEQRPN